MKPAIGGRCPVPDNEARAALARVVQSVALRGAPRLIAFLRYVTDRALGGGKGRLKGYTIATEALGRSPDFDPVIDPIVRVEATRLRRAMARYYAGEGLADPIEIKMPLGAYAPRFHRRAVAAPALVPAVEGETGLADMLEALISSRRVQVRTMLSEMRAAKQSLQRYRALSPPGLACPPPARLLPPAPSHNAARPDGREEQQAEGAFAARPRRSRTG